MRQKLLSSLCVLLGLYASNSMASFDGKPGPSSTGEIHIRLVISQGIQVSNLQDIEVTVSAQSNADVVIRKRFCVSSNVEGLYTITGLSDRGGSSPFSLSSSSGDQIDYQLHFRHNLANSIGDELQPNVPSPIYQLRKSGVNCNGQDNAELGLVIPASEIQQAKDHDYGGFLNLTVAIE